MKRSQVIDPYKGKKGVYHLSMEHLSKHLLFKTKEDFLYGVNALALLVLNTPSVHLLCYCLMNNHFHLLLTGKLSDCLMLYDKYLWKLSLLISNRDGRTGILKQKAMDVKPVTGTEQLLKCVAYILRNPYKARIASPFSYRWSSMDAYFNDQFFPGSPVKEWQVNDIRKLLRSKERLPKEVVIVDGAVSNRCFVDYRTVEKRFQDSVTFFDTLRLYDLESAYRLASGIHETLKFDDTEMLAKAKTICQKEFHTETLDQLDRKTLTALARTLARRFGAGNTQLARILDVSPDYLDMVF